MRDIAWFTVQSYRYIAPRGVAEHIRFAADYPRALRTFMRLRAEKEAWRD